MLGMPSVSSMIVCSRPEITIIGHENYGCIWRWPLVGRVLVCEVAEWLDRPVARFLERSSRPLTNPSQRLV